MPSFCFRPRRPDEDYDAYEQAFIGAWNSFCSRRRLNPYPAQSTGDRYLDARNASTEYAARPRWGVLRHTLGRLARQLRQRLTPGPHSPR
ncbi:hypothetical protein ACF065_32390 [Streptomyces sp. NPDC015232]|uniref:hypothetical protein n=1 Tax=unclassified Streptomyces TaxID=2593676 RepID=UPI0033B12D96